MKRVTNLCSQHRTFWREKPLFLFAVSLLIGTSGPLFWDYPWSVLLVGVWAVYLVMVRSWVVLCVLVVGWGYGSWRCDCPQVGKQRALFSISSLQPYASPFYKGLLYKGTLYGEERTAVPVSVFYRGKLGNHPAANCDYVVMGELIQRERHDFLFKVKEWEPVKGTFSLAEMRYQMKERFRVYLGKHLSSRCAAFLGSVTTGDVEDRLLRYEFGRVGLQHLLAISGFHFAILLGMCSFVCRKIFPGKGAVIFLLVVVNGYFLFVGSAPAVQRSWTVAQLYLLAEGLKRSSSALNLLGSSCILELVLDPRVAGSLGFQLSFLSTTGILLLSPLVERGLRLVLPKRSAEEILELGVVDKIVYGIAATLRRCLSLNFAVNLMILPLLLYHFHQFPFLSFLYNLFVPVLVGVGLFVLCVCFLFPFVFAVCDFFTCQILDLVSNPPLALDYAWRSNSVPSWSVPLYLLAVLLVAIGLTREERFCYNI